MHYIYDIYIHLIKLVLVHILTPYSSAIADKRQGQQAGTPGGHDLFRVVHTALSLLLYVSTICWSPRYC